MNPSKFISTSLLTMRRAFGRRQRGFTLIELMVATAILVILVGGAVPIAKNVVYREREHELRYDLWMIRDAIDRYKDAADRGAFQLKVGSEGYPPDLDTLVKGVDVGGKKMKFLRKVPVDPMTNQSIIRAKEAKLHQNLTTINKVIQEYSLDKKKAPQALEDLVPGYLKFIPEDITGRNDTWATEAEDSENAWDPTQTGIAGVHSGSNEISSDGSA